jgi:hypothetical protein
MERDEPPLHEIEQVERQTKQSLEFASNHYVEKNINVKQGISTTHIPRWRRFFTTIENRSTQVSAIGFAATIHCPYTVPYHCDKSPIKTHAKNKSAIGWCAGFTTEPLDRAITISMEQI